MRKGQQQRRHAEFASQDRDEREAKALVAEIRSGNKHAFTNLVRRYRDQVAALAYKMVSDYDEAADIAQEVFVKLATNIGRYDESRNFYTWLHRITVNAAIDYMRKHGRHRHERLQDFHDTVEGFRSDPELSFRRRQIDGYIRRAAQSLDDKQRSAFMLRDVEGCKIDDVAEVMEMPKSTVRWYLHRARTKIRKELARQCPHLLFLLGIR